MPSAVYCIFTFIVKTQLMQRAKNRRTPVNLQHINIPFEEPVKFNKRGSSSNMSAVEKNKRLTTILFFIAILILLALAFSSFIV